MEHILKADGISYAPTTGNIIAESLLASLQLAANAIEAAGLAVHDRCSPIDEAAINNLLPRLQRVLNIFERNWARRPKQAITPSNGGE